MRRPLLLLAVALVLVSNAVVLGHVWWNRGGESEAIELTERELRLARMQPESSALFFDLTWEPLAGRPAELAAEWFTRARLEELGFDCSFPTEDPKAVKHYRSMPAKEAFAVLEYQPGEMFRSNLRAVDVGRDYAALRRRYPDSRRHLIAPSLVRLRLEVNWDPNTRKYTSGAWLHGSVVQLQVGRVSAGPCQALMETVKQQTYDMLQTQTGREPAPRYAVVLRYGRLHEPWVESCRLLPVSTR